MTTNETDTRKQDCGYFGLCPKCRNTDGYLNIGRTHHFFCDVHKTRWCGGQNLFSSWQYETEDEQRKTYEEKNFGAYEKVEPIYPPCGPDGQFQPEPGSDMLRSTEGANDHASDH
jgi:hypothetical protein